MRKGLTALFLLLVCLSGQVIAQSRTVKGTVTSSEDGSPIPGATILAKGTNVGTVTNAEGAYTLNVPEGVTTLVVKFIGMRDQEARITGTTVNVVLSTDVTNLTETVVTAQAIRRDKRSLGFAAPTVKNDELTRGQSVSALNGLTGKVAGLNISGTASAPGSSTRIVLRGGSSISGNNQALLVIDGVPIDNSGLMGGGDSRSSVDFGNRGNDISPDDIESINILKGPAAAALYGSRASNGALIITTKTGKKGQQKMNVTFNTANTFSNVLKIPEYQNEFGQGYDDPSYPNGYHTDPKENWSWGAPFTGEMQEWGQEINGVRQQKPYSALPDNVKDFFDLGMATNNNLAFSGAGDKTTYFLSLNALNSDGVMPGHSDTYNRYNVRFNGSADLAHNITSSLNINYSKIKSNMVQGGQGDGSVWNSVIQTPRDIPLTSLKDLNNPYNSFGSIFDVAGNPLYGYYGAYTVNPYWQLANYRNENMVDRVTGNFQLVWKPLSWLNITERLGADVYADRRKYKYPKFSFAPADNTSGEYDAAANTQTAPGKYQEETFNLSEIVHDLMVTAEHTFSSDFKGSLMVGNNVRQRQFDVSDVQTNESGGLVVPGWYNFGNSNGPIDAVNTYSNRRLVGLYADLNLNYREMLFLGATARNDWSSTLPKNNRSFFYPSVNLSFVFTELLKDSRTTNWLDYGKIRGSWAQVGNDADPYQLTTYFDRTNVNSTGFGSTRFPLNGVPGLTQSNVIGNPELRPEITTAFEVGTELSFFRNRLSVDFSYYQNKSKDQILSIPVTAATGYTFKVVNAGSIQNRGVELALRGTPIQTSYGLSVELYGTFAKNNSEVLSLLPGVNQVVLGGFGGMAIVAAVGKPYGTFYSQEVQRTPEGKVIVGTNGMPLLTTTSVYLGTYNPDYQASLGTNIKFKNWSFSALFDTKQGGMFFSRTKDMMDFVGVSKESAANGRVPHPFPNSVRVDPSDPTKYIENDTPYDMVGWWTQVIPSGAHVLDASFVKLRETSLTYRLPKSLLNRGPFGDVTVGLFGNNLFMWTPKENEYVDPEVNSGGSSNEQGLDFSAQPSLRNFGFNVKVTF
ncbi:SusC/RagA family TonB-linked outer membrane protein [Chitinophaga sp. XS-30]|uniref:SusC/RagA family TonB-linked outer membrane protein n=1 Tax=Chitinophaga sp. XS-30 TaxID=2604421 RepID=UPI0011DD698A|nr:SusC/RagA family TonB-linked outer membrane protein [Chitinophaga sp. XS-30]QEH40343.1 SusC/RagA family TonB-linked outer membrane protein [Chitinophaga sp. XS-30]